MPAIEVIPVGSAEFQVEVSEGDDTTTHRVTVPEGYAEELGAADAALTDLVRESFRFLLQREPKEQILRSFELPVIERYFPEYRTEIAGRVGRD
jgi:hypothetical protein